MDYTAEVWKKNKRIKNGEKLIKEIDFVDQLKESQKTLKKFVQKVFPKDDGYTVKIFETYVTRRNLMSGEEFQDRYNTPGFCSPSTEHVNEDCV